MRSDLWATFNWTLESLFDGEMLGRSAAMYRIRTRPVQRIDQNAKPNRALRMLAEKMRRIKG